MSSTALALKYRPTCFSDLVGQNAISQTLSLALDSKHISHAYLFSGLRGSGKTSSARIFARALECEKGPTSTPCGECASCVAALQNKHIDIIEMDAASSRGIDDIKRVIEQTKYRPSLGRYKIFIIDEVHMLSKEAFNALLKTLEEPPEFVKFILATTDPLKLPATILSRTQHFRFKQISHRLVIEHIANILNKENVSYEPQALDIIARSGAGSLRDTLTLLEQAIIFCKNHIEVAQVSQMLGVIDPQVLSDFFQSILRKDSQSMQNILDTFYEYECEMIIDEMMLFLKDKLLQKDVDFPPLLLERFARILTESKSLLWLNTDGAFVLLLCAMKMQEALKVKDIESMIEELEGELFGQDSTRTPATEMTNPQNIAQTPSPQAAQSHTSAPTTHTPAKEPVNAQIRFNNLITKIKDRNMRLGEVFEQNVSFVSFENHLLRWQSKAQGADKELLREHAKIIKALVADVFGTQTQIEQVAKNANPAPPTESTPPTHVKSTQPHILNAQDAPMATPHSTDSIITESAPESITESTPKNTKEAFLVQNRNIIEAINNSVGIKDVITQGEK